MERQSKLDLAAGAAIAIMFLGTAMLTVSSLGLFLIAGGVTIMLTLFVATSRKKK